MMMYDMVLEADYIYDFMIFDLGLDIVLSFLIDSWYFFLIDYDVYVIDLTKLA